MKNKWFEFGIFNIKLLFPLLNAFPCLLRYYFGKKLDYFILHPFVSTFLMFLSEMLAGSFELISFFKQKVTIEEKIIEEMQRESNVVKLEKKEQPSKWLVVLLIISTATIDFLTATGSKIVGSFDSNLDDFEFEMKIGLLIFTGLFSSRFLHIIIYKHQILSIIIMSIGIVLVSSYHLFSEDFEQNILKAFIYLVLFSIYAIQNVTEHWLMRNRFFSPFKLIFFEGVVGSSICIFLFTFLWAIPCESGWNFCFRSIENFIDTLKIMFSRWDLVIFVLCWLIFSATYNNCIMITNYFFTPTHRTISDMMSSCFIWLLNLGIEPSPNNPWVLPLIGYLIISFAVIVYHELIILHFWGLSKDIKVEIMRRSQMEEKLYPEVVEIQRLDN